MQTKKPVII